jgi:hypothetical protein
MKKIEVWQTSDGKLFLIEQEEMAKRHENATKGEVERSALFKKSKPFIRKFIFDNLKDYLTNKDIEEEKIGCYYEGEWGWDCKGDGNPIDKCVYSMDICLEDDMCVFCGEPEERK